MSIQPILTPVIEPDIAPPPLPGTQPDAPTPARPSRLGRHRRPIALGLAILGLAAGAALGWKSSVDRGTALRMERAASAARTAELERDNSGLRSQVSSLISSLATCRQAVGEMAGIVVVLGDYPELVGRAAVAVLDYDFVELGRVAGIMEQLDERLADALATSTGAIDTCGAGLSA